jgi:hypothetical protein
VTEPDPPRPCSLLVASLTLTAVSLALPRSFGPLGPLAAGVLAFLGDRRVKASGGTLRGPVLAKVAMTSALLLLVAMAVVMIRNAPAAAAEVRMQAQTARVEGVLRSGTPDGAFDLLSPEARAGADRAAFVESMRAAMARLGSLDSLGPSRAAGGDWNRAAAFQEGDAADLRLAYAFDATFQRGKGTVTVEVLVRRRGSDVTADILSLRVEPSTR